METKKLFSRLFFIASFLLVFFQYGYTQSASNNQIYEAFSRGKMDIWYNVMQSFESTMDKNCDTDKLELINYYYGYVGWLISVEKNEMAHDYIDKTFDMLEQLTDKDPLNATAIAYKGAFIAYEIGISSYKVIYLGPKSMKCIDDALKIDPTNIQAHIEKGNAKYYCPPSFGGSKDEAIIHYKKAVEYMEQQQLVENNWMYLNVMTALGLAYEATDRIESAKLCYEKILTVKPNYMWVGEELYPDMLARHNM